MDRVEQRIEQLVRQAGIAQAPNEPDDQFLARVRRRLGDPPGSDPEHLERGDGRAVETPSDDATEVVYDYRVNAPADRAPSGRGYVVPRQVRR